MLRKIAYWLVKKLLQNDYISWSNNKLPFKDIERTIKDIFKISIDFLQDTYGEDTINNSMYYYYNIISQSTSIYLHNSFNQYEQLPIHNEMKEEYNEFFNTLSRGICKEIKNNLIKE
jgi:hypothetical protein